MAAVISVLSSDISVYAADDYDIKIQFADSSAVHGEKYAIVPVNISENSGIACLSARILTDSSVTIDGYAAKNDFEGELTPDGNSFLWITKDTMNNYANGTFIDVYANISAVKYPGVYSISFTGIGNATMAVDEDVNDLNVEWINGTITVNGNSDDIAMADMLGDIDDDGEITSYDALLILKNVTGLNDFDIKQNVVADADYDKSVTSNDALNILQMTTGNISDFSGAVAAGIYLDENNENILNISYYKNIEGSVVSVS